MLHRTILPSALALGVLIGAAPQGDKQADKPKAIKDVMALHKGKDSFLSKVTGAKSTEDENKKLLAFYEVLATLKPPQGEEKSWKDKTDALVAAAKEVIEKKEGAVDKLKKATNCKACHDVHKPK